MMANSQEMAVEGQGTVYIPSLKTEISGVFYAPELSFNIISVSALAEQGFTVTFEKQECIIKKNGKIVAKVKQENNLYMLKSQTHESAHMIHTNKPQHDNCIHLLHRRLGHVNFRSLQKMEHFARDINIKECKNYLDCDVCKRSKTNVAPKGRKSDRVTTRPFELVHADLMGPFHANSQLYIPLHERKSQLRQTGTHKQGVESCAGDEEGGATTDDDEEEEDERKVKQKEDSDEEEHEEEEAHTSSQTETHTNTHGPRRSQRANKGVPPNRYGVGGITVCNVYIEPRNYKDVLKLPDYEKNKWLEAMEEEMKSMEEHQVFTETKLPAEHKVISSKWVFKRKLQNDGNYRYKARLVAQGFTQKKFIHYDEVFSPTVRSETLRTTLAFAVSKNYVIYHYDITTAYLNADLKEELYMAKAPGFEGTKPELVYRLNKAIYGLKQSAKNWNDCLHQVLMKLGYKNGLADPCLYTKKVGNDLNILLRMLMTYVL
ncbi:uncharacterized protein LOC144586859 [Pogona vitticeps]